MGPRTVSRVVFPLVHDFHGDRVLVLGGGPVGARRARRLSRVARVVVISPEFADGDFGNAQLVRAAPSPAQVADWIAAIDPVLVIAATDDPTVNEAAVAAGSDNGSLVNRADTDLAVEPGVVSIPAVARDGSVVAAVTTGGDSPALSGFLRERIEELLQGAGEVADASRAIRSELRERGVDSEKRRAILRSMLESDAVWDAARDPHGDTLAAARAAVESDCLDPD